VNAIMYCAPEPIIDIFKQQHRDSVEKGAMGRGKSEFFLENIVINDPWIGDSHAARDKKSSGRGYG